MPTVLILGGCGFVGRNLVSHLIDNDLADKIYVADKAPPQTAWLNEKHKGAFANSKVQFKQANLVNAGHLDKVFSLDEFDYVINCAAEARYGQSEEVYKEHILQLSVGCAKRCADKKVKRYVELSTAQVYSSDKKASNEESKTSPWTTVAKYKLMVEKELANIDGLDFCIVRPGITYGIGDKQGLMPRLIIAAVYKHMNEKMKLLWSKDLRMSTVHVEDVSRALWFLCEKGSKGGIYNLVDKQDSSQGTISDTVCSVFGIEYDFFGSIVSNMAKLNMSSVVEDSNEKHLAPWSEACSKDNISNTPLSPYMDQELLYNNNLNVDGSKIEKLGFTYQHPHLKAESLRVIVDDYVTLNVFPPSLA